MSDKKIDLPLAISSASMVVTLLIMGYTIYSVKQYEKASHSLISEAVKKTRSVCNVLHSGYQSADTPQKRLRLSLEMQRKGGKELPGSLPQSVQSLVVFSTQQPPVFWSIEAERFIYFCEEVRVLEGPRG